MKSAKRLGITKDSPPRRKKVIVDIAEQYLKFLQFRLILETIKPKSIKRTFHNH